MREIKFRAWDKENGCWFDDNWNLSLQPDGTVFGRFDNEDWIQLDESRYVLEQYTGLTANGVEIYEGDLVKMFDGQQLPTEVVFGWGEDNEMYAWSYGWCTKSPTDENGLIFGAWPEDLKEWEVIGNIHENPELLKEAIV